MASDEDQIWVKVRHKHDLWTVNKGLVAFETERMLVTFPGIMPTRQYIKPKEVIRKDPITLKVNTGFWNFGWFTLTFDSEKDADRVELEFRKLLPVG